MWLLATAPTSLIVPWNTSNIVTVPFSSSSKSLFSWDLDEKLLSFREAAMTCLGGLPLEDGCHGNSAGQRIWRHQIKLYGEKISIHVLGDDQSTYPPKYSMFKKRNFLYMI